MKTTTLSAKPAEIHRDWFVIDANERILGRMATEIARRLRGKHKTIYTPHVDTGDYIVIINANKLLVTGNKMKSKIYYHHTGYIGGIKSISLKKKFAEAPDDIIKISVKGMLPKNSLGRSMLSKLKIYSGKEHPHRAQNPKLLEI
ncbi:MAG: 50S ribosomal protein L13 [Piscirickettsiaceae bacterium]|nr:50S ribosomal protein L13 [Piscirickettsiaceae bacterium]